MAETNAELVRRGYDGVARGDFEAIAALLAPDVRWHGGEPSSPDACHNRDQALSVMRRAREAGGIGELVDVIEADESRVVVLIHPPRDGDETRRAVANLTTFRDGLVVEMVHYADPDDALAAAGL